MNRLRTAHRVTATIVLSAWVGYGVYIVEHPADGASRAEAAFRTFLAVASAAWVIFYAAHVIISAMDSHYIAAMRAGCRDIEILAAAVEASERDRDLQIAKVHDAVASVQVETDRELQSSMAWVIQRFNEISGRP